MTDRMTHGVIGRVGKAALAMVVAATIAATLAGASLPRSAAAAAAGPARKAAWADAALAAGAGCHAWPLRLVRGRTNYDGDTLYARPPAPAPADAVIRIRLKGLDTPEMTGRCPAEAALASAARDRLGQLLEAAAVVEICSVSRDRYHASGRVAAQVLVDGRDVAGVLIAEGLARPYERGRRASWCE